MTTDTQKKARAAAYARKRNYIHDYKLEHGCSLCGFKKSAVSLDLHHPDDHTIPSYGGQRRGLASMAWDTLKAELESGIILCRNCHNMLHHDPKALTNNGGASTYDC
jgi:5-methylcytosine-specific restriction endonuclease McrA